MKLKVALLFVAAVLSCSSAFAWKCPSGQHQVEVPKGTPEAVLVEGLYFHCTPDTPPTPPSTPGTSNSNSNQNTNTNNSTSGAVSGSSSSATGGQGGKATSSSDQNQSQGQGQSQSSTSSATGNGNGSNNSVSNTLVQRNTPMAYAPEAIPSAPCIKGYSGGASGPMFGAAIGGGKVDKGCDARETARQFALLGNPTAAAKILCSTDASKNAKLTLEDCLNIVAATAVPAVQAVPPVQVNILNPVASSSTTEEEETITDPATNQFLALIRSMDNANKASLDEAVIFSKANPEGYIVVQGNTHTTKLARAAQQYLRLNGASSVQLQLTTEEREGVYILYVNN